MMRGSRAISRNRRFTLTPLEECVSCMHDTGANGMTSHAGHEIASGVGGRTAADAVTYGLLPDPTAVQTATSEQAGIEARGTQPSGRNFVPASGRRPVGRRGTSGRSRDVRVNTLGASPGEGLSTREAQER